MISPRLIELMNLAIDGVAGPDERAELESAIASDPAARSYYESLTRMVEKLDADPMPDPPAELEPRVHDALRRASIERRLPATSAHRGFFSFGMRPWSTFGLGLAAGVLILAVIQNSRNGMWESARDVNPGSVSGSMVSDRRSDVGSIPVETEDGTVSGTASIYQDGPAMVVQVQLQSTMTVEWKVEFDGNAWSLLRVERRGSATSAFAANRSNVQGMHTGEGGVTLVFSGAPEAAQSVVFKVLKGGQPVFEGHPSTVK